MPVLLKLMKNCLAFSALVGSRDAWRPCSRRAIRGSRFCGRHTEVIAGIMLGICVHGGLAEREQRSIVVPKRAASLASQRLDLPNSAAAPTRRAISASPLAGMVNGIPSGLPRTDR